MSNFVNFIIYLLTVTFTPGPNNVLSLSNAQKFGFKRNLSFVAGAFCGILTITTLVSVLSAVISQALPQIVFYLKFVGSAYIIWMAFKLLKSDFTKTADTTNEKPVSFVNGLLLQFVNPKLYIGATNSLVSFFLPYDPTSITFVVFVLTYSCMCIVSISTWGACGTALRSVLSKHNKIVNWIMFVLLIYCAVSMFL